MQLKSQILLEWLPWKKPFVCLESEKQNITRRPFNTELSSALNYLETTSLQGSK